MLSPNIDSIRIFLHVLAAAVWVGGQIVVAGVVPGLRKTSGTEGTKAVANGFAKVAWPAYILALLSGMWSLLDRGESTTEYSVTFGIKFLFYVAAGGTAVAHARSSRRPVIAATGALGLVFSLVVLYLGTLLTTGSV